MSADLTAILAASAIIAVVSVIVWFIHFQTLRSLKKSNAELEERANYFFRENGRLVAENGQLNTENGRLNTVEEQLRKRVQEIEPAFYVLARLYQSLQAMKRVWIEHQSISTEANALADANGEEIPHHARNEASCEQILRENMWVLAPELTPENINKSSSTSLRTILESHFSNPILTEQNTRLRLDLCWEPDICGWFDTSAALQLNSDRTRTYVVIELKHSQEPVRTKWMEQCYAYALALMWHSRELRRADRVFRDWWFDRKRHP
jgi:hypothetical protein